MMPLALPPWEIPYTRISVGPSSAFPNGGRIYRPVVNILIERAPHGLFRCRARLDTGADGCMFPLSFAGALGLSLERMDRADTLGVTGSGVAYYTDLRIFVVVVDGGLLPITARAGFTEGMNALGEGILGHQGFFDSCTVTFNVSRGTFTIDPRGTD